MSDSGTMEQTSKAVDAYGKEVDLSDFEESYYHPDEVQIGIGEI